MAAALRRLRVHRSAVLIIAGLALIVSGVWIGLAALFGAAIGAGGGSVLAGVTLLVVEGLTEDDTP